MNDVEAVKSRLDIVEVVKQYVPSLKKAGHSYKGLCPFHGEKTPSFIVTPDLGIYKCFGCGEGGDVLEFIKKMERVDFGEALKIAADRVGYTLTETKHKQDDQVVKQQERIYEANKLASQYWHYILNTHKAGKVGRDYVQKRKIRQAEVEKFQLGYAPIGANLVPFLIKKGFTKSELVTWGLAVDRKGEIVDKFRDRLILPIWNMKGQIIGFSGRIVTPNEYAPKYLNSPETLVYKKGEILMGLYQAKEAARKQNFIILEEGNIDLLSSHKVGVENIAATGGTALTEQQCRLIKRYADTVYFCFDTDQAGIKALIKGVELAEKVGLKHKALEIGDYQDPDALISAEPTKWSEIVSKPENTLAHLLRILQVDLDLGTADGKSTLMQRMVPILATVKDDVQVQHYANELAVLVGVSKDSVLNSLAARTQPVYKSASSEPAETPKVQAPQSPVILPNQREMYLLALILQINDVEGLDISQDIFQDVNCKEIFIKLSKFGDATGNFAKLAEELSDGGKEALQQILAIDVTGIDNFHEELQHVYKILYSTFLRAQILDLRRQLQSDAENTDLLSKLQYFTAELKQLSN
jgi:DNA primase